MAEAAAQSIPCSAGVTSCRVLYIQYGSGRLKWLILAFARRSSCIIAKLVEHLLVHRRSTSLAELGLLLALLVDTLGQQLGVLVGSVLGSLRTSSLEGEAVSLVLDTLRGDESLDLGGLGIGLCTLLLGSDFATDDELAVMILVLYQKRSNIYIPDIILLGETEEAADLGGTLGTEALGLNGVGEAGDILLALLDNSEGKNSQVLGDDATTDGLALALTSAARSVAGVAFGEEELDSGRKHL